MDKYRSIVFIIPLLITFLIGQFASPYFSSFIMEIFIWSLFAMSFNILFGYTGLLSFGQSLFFGLGCYSFSLSIIHWQFSICGAILLSVAISFLVAAITGGLIIRIVSHYFVIISVLLSLIPFYIANHMSWLTGGDDGIPVQLPTNFFPYVGLSPYNATHMYWVICLFVIAILFLCIKFLNSPVGLIFKAVKENELRAEFLGYDPRKYRYLSWIIAGTLAGLSGSLYVLAFKYTSSMYFNWTLSGEAIIWTIAGGSGTLLGPILGTASLLLIKDDLSTYVASYPILIGILLILIIRFKPSGLVGIINSIYNRIHPTLKNVSISKHSETTLLSFIKIPQNQNSILSTQNLGITFDGIQALKNISLNLSMGEIKIRINMPNGKEWFTSLNNQNCFPCLSFVGPNGAGKTTLFNLLSGVHNTANGCAQIFEKDIFSKGKFLSKLKLSKYSITCLGLSRTFQQSQLFPGLTVEENFQIAVQFRINPWAMTTKTKQIKYRKNAVENLLLLTNLIEEQKKIAKELSYGRQKMLEIGLAIASGGRILLLDEPTAGVSPIEIILITDLILKLAKNYTVLVIEHDLEVVKKLRFTTCIMADGEIIAAGVPEQVLDLAHVKQRFYAS
ncbi:MAG: ATP-binding cassette domain-containing protein [Bacteroidales bacterium]|jgi:branched-chain amino acid transport system permease protein